MKTRMRDDSSEDQLEDVFATVNGWFEAFARSPGFQRLNDSQQRKAGAIAEFFGRYTYEYLGLLPSEWTCDAVVECCTDILPRKVSAEVPFFEAMAPVLRAFFSFLEDQSLHPKGRALSEAVAGLRDEIVAQARDQSNWGPAKRFVMAAVDAGVDIQDPAALNAFMVGFNLRQAARNGFGDAARPQWGASPAPSKAKRPPPPANPYDPCPCGSGKKYKFCCKENSAS